MLENENDLIAQLPGRRHTSWSALFAGIVVLTAIGWFLMLMGSALGVSIADASDMSAMGQGLGIGTVLWMLISWLVAYFVAALLVVRLHGTPDKTVGVSHGITLWGSGVVATFLLATLGVTGLLNVGGAVVGGASQAVAGAAQGASSLDLQGAGEQGSQALEEAGLQDEIMAQIKRQASQAVADLEEPGQNQVSAADVRAAIDELDRDALRSIAVAIVRGETEQAKDILTASTSLQDREVDAVIEGVTTSVESSIQEFRTRAEEALEAGADYAQAVLWTAFLGAALALSASIAGAALGAHITNANLARTLPTPPAAGRT